jgi:hypothetical protein
MEGAAIAVGTMRHLGKDDREEVVIELLSSDALSTSAIEGKARPRSSTARLSVMENVNIIRPPPHAARAAGR